MMATMICTTGMNAETNTGPRFSMHQVSSTKDTPHATIP
jgi:hypothetical protein